MYIACNDNWYINFLYCVVMKFNSVLCEVIVKISKKMKSQQLQQVYRYLEIYVRVQHVGQLYKCTKV